MAELKPCPFCGGEAECSYSMATIDLDMRPVRIVCKECGATTKLIKVSNKYCATDKAVEEWNRRTDNER